MQSFISTHKKKQSNFSSTVGSKFDGVHLNKSVIEADTSKDGDKQLSSLLLKSEAILEKYRTKNEQL